MRSFVSSKKQKKTFLQSLPKWRTPTFAIDPKFNSKKASHLAHFSRMSNSHFFPSITLKSALVCLSMRAFVSHAFFPMPHSQLFPYITSICFEVLSFSHSPFFPYVTHPFVLYLTGCFCVFEQAFLLLACDGKTRAAQTPPPPCLRPPLRTLSSPLPTHPPVSSLPQPTTPSSDPAHPTRTLTPPRHPRPNPTTPLATPTSSRTPRPPPRPRPPPPPPPPPPPQACGT